MKIRVRVTYAFICLIVFLSLADAGYAVQYQVIDLGVLGVFDPGIVGTPSSVASGINNSGQIVGTSNTRNGHAHAFLYENGTMLDIDTFDGTSSMAQGINNLGQIVGQFLPTSGYYHPFLYENNSMTDLGQQGDAYAINDIGQIVGVNCYTNSNGGNGCSGAFIYENSTWTNLGTYGAFDINNSGQIAGGNGFYDNGVWSELGSLDGGALSGNTINDLGQISGDFKASDGYHHAFLYESGTAIDLGGPVAGVHTRAKDINNRGQIVGYYHLGGDDYQAFLYENGLWTDLGTLGGNQSVACGINDFGQIVGYAETSDGSAHAVLWNPVPEPASLLLLGSGLIGFIGLKCKWK